MQKITAADATREGADHLAARASDEPIVVTDDGRPVAVVLSPRYHEDMVRAVREASAAINAGMVALLARHGAPAAAGAAPGARDRPDESRAVSS